MNKGAIKSFAIWARNKLMADVKSNAYLIGIREDGIQEPLPQSTNEIEYYDIGSGEPYALIGDEIKKRSRIISHLQYDINDSDYNTAFRNLLEHTASTWFNRLCAIRFMEVNEYFDDGLRVLSSSEEGKRESDLMSSPFDSDIDFSDAERIQIRDWKLSNKSEELFVFLLKKKCMQLSGFLPGLFETADDSTDLLVRFSIFDKEGIIDHLVNDIDEEDWKEQVQIIGWLYQFYNTEFKDETYRLLKKQNLTKERIPSVTQLFTPEWIVKYMVENSLGRIWTDGHPESKTEFLPTGEEQAEYAAGKRDADDHKWHYYLEEVGQEPEVQNQQADIRGDYAKLNPEDLSFIDPCLGSGHIACYAFDILMQIYTSQGYTARDAVRSIIEKNLYGLDIDERAYQLAYFSVMMKARQYDRGAFRRGLSPRVYAFEESNRIKPKYLEIFGAGMSPIDRNLAIEQMKELLITFKDAKELGSIIKVKPLDWELLKNFTSSFSSYGDITMLADLPEDIGDLQRKLQRMVNIGELLSRQYWVTCTNPPYMAPTANQRTLIDKWYKEGKADLYAVFIIRLYELTVANGIQSMITMHSWMFLSSFKSLRENILLSQLINMAHLGARAFDEIGGEVVQTTTWVRRKCQNNGYVAIYHRLMEFNGQSEKENAYLSERSHYYCNSESFKTVPDSPIVYWLSDSMLKAFEESPIDSVCDPRRTLQTGDAPTFMRYWFEVDETKTDFRYFPRQEMLESDKKWFMFSYGGQLRKWYGNLSLVVNWKNNGSEIKATGNAIIPSESQYFEKTVGWSKVTTGDISMRLYPQGIIPGDATACLFNCRVDMRLLEAFLNSKVAMCFLQVLSPTLNYATGTIAKVPFFTEEILGRSDDIIHLTDACNSLSKDDWDSYETSWDFRRHPLIKECNTIKGAYSKWSEECWDRFTSLKNKEEELNNLFIDAYGLKGELSAEVDRKNVTVRLADEKKDVRSLISYAVGCMFGRYSLDVDGLIYAGGNWQKALETKYKSFIPDEDNCIPITDENYFSDDIVGRFVEFVRTVYGEDTLEENLSFIANALDNGGNDSRDSIRRYFLDTFFVDHCKRYVVGNLGKRPIYWLFDSGKQNGFKALVYMHRWDANTIATVRTRYVAKMLEKYENELRSMDLQMEHLTDPRQKASLQKRKEKITKQIDEIRKYDELIGHMALEYIDIDLDDGVKVNHEKVQIDRNGDKYQILAPIK